MEDNLFTFVGTIIVGFVLFWLIGTILGGGSSHENPR